MTQLLDSSECTNADVANVKCYKATTLLQP